jgi:hypothetical protein
VRPGRVWGMREKKVHQKKNQPGLRKGKKIKKKRKEKVELEFVTRDP